MTIMQSTKTHYLEHIICSNHFLELRKSIWREIVRATTKINKLINILAAHVFLFFKNKHSIQLLQ